MRDKKKQRKIDTIGQSFGMSPQTKADDHALDLIAFRREVIDGIDRIKGKGMIRDIDELAPDESDV